MEERRRHGPTNNQLSIGGVVAIVSLIASGVATYSALQNDISSLKRGETYQERTNERLSGEMKALRDEQRETMKEFNEKLDRIIERWPRK